MRDLLKGPCRGWSESLTTRLCIVLSWRPVELHLEQERSERPNVIDKSQTILDRNPTNSLLLIAFELAAQY